MNRLTVSIHTTHGCELQGADPANPGGHVWRHSPCPFGKDDVEATCLDQKTGLPRCAHLKPVLVVTAIGEPHPEAAKRAQADQGTA